MNTVDFNERQSIGAAVSEKNDIIPALPLELILQIFDYLHILSPWSLQLVGRRWRKVLYSEDFLRATLCRWDTHDPSDSFRSVDDISRDSIQDRIRHMQAIRLGKPFLVTTLDDTGTGLQGPQPQLSQQRLDFRGHRIAYISSQSGDGDTVIVRDLISGAASMLRGEARERIMSVVLTTTLVAFVTFEGCLYVTEFSDHMFLRKTSRVKLPSARVRGSSGSGEIVALAMGGDLYESTYIAEVLIYNARVQRLTSLPVGSMYKKIGGNVRSLNSCTLKVNNANNTIDVFTLTLAMGAVPGRSDADKSIQIRHIRLSFGGQLLSVGSWEHALPFETSVRSAHFTMTPLQPTGYRGISRLQVGELPILGGLPIGLKFDVLFDIQTATFSSNDCNMEGNLAAKIGQPATEEMRRSKAATGIPETLQPQWKGRVLDLQQRTSVPNENWIDYMALMNDTFLVSLQVNELQMQRSRIKVFCFDENVQMHGSRSMKTMIPDLDAPKR